MTNPTIPPLPPPPLPTAAGTVTSLPPLPTLDGITAGTPVSPAPSIEQSDPDLWDALSEGERKALAGIEKQKSMFDAILEIPAPTAIEAPPLGGSNAAWLSQPTAPAQTRADVVKADRAATKQAASSPARTAQEELFRKEERDLKVAKAKLKAEGVWITLTHWWALASAAFSKLGNFRPIVGLGVGGTIAAAIFIKVNDGNYIAGAAAVFAALALWVAGIVWTTNKVKGLGKKKSTAPVSSGDPRSDKNTKVRLILAQSDALKDLFAPSSKDAYKMMVVAPAEQQRPAAIGKGGRKAPTAVKYVTVVNEEARAQKVLSVLNKIGFHVRDTEGNVIIEHYKLTINTDGLDPKKVEGLKGAIASALGLYDIAVVRGQNASAVTFECDEVKRPNRLLITPPQESFYDTHRSDNIFRLPMALTEKGDVWIFPGGSCLIAGTTGSGKGSVVNAFVWTMEPFVAKGLGQIWGVDPKNSEFEKFSDTLLFHELPMCDWDGETLISPIDIVDEDGNVLQPDDPKYPYGEERIVTDTYYRVAVTEEQALNTMKLANREMMKRAENNTSTKNKVSLLRPQIKVLVDEFALLMETKTVEKELLPLAKKIARLGRSLGMDLVIATQTVTADVIPTALRNNFPNRVSLRQLMPSHVDITLGENSVDRGATSHLLAPATEGNDYATAGMADVIDQNSVIQQVRFPEIKGPAIDAMAERWRTPEGRAKRHALRISHVNRLLSRRDFVAYLGKRMQAGELAPLDPTNEEYLDVVEQEWTGFEAWFIATSDPRKPAAAA